MVSARLRDAAGDDGVLPTDMLSEVLLRLPADELCRLRLVCRSWRSLTSDAGFDRTHASRHPLLAGVHIVRGIGYEIRVVDLFSGDIIRRVVPAADPRYGINAQLDLVCVSALAISTRKPSSVLNLATGEVVATFLPKERSSDNGIIISPFLLGHIPSTGEFKVFYWRHLRGEGGGHGNVQTCCVATLVGGGGSGSGNLRWRETPTSPPAVLGIDLLTLRDSVVVAGVAYILFSRSYSYSQRNDHANLEPDAMAVFDMAAEEWRPAPLRGPLSSRLTGDDARLVYDEHRHDFRLAAVDDCLVTLHHNRCRDSSMDLWFLVDMVANKGLWTKRFSIPCAAPCKPHACNRRHPLLLLDDGRIVMWEGAIQDQVLRIFDPRTSKWSDISTLKNYFSVNMYQGNLLCPGLHG